MINMIVNPIDEVFAALASLPRRQMLSFLSQTALSTHELAGRFGMSSPAVSRHPAILQNAGLVTGQRQGQRMLYRLNRDALQKTLAPLARQAVSAGGAAALSGRLPLAPRASPIVERPGRVPRTSGRGGADGPARKSPRVRLSLPFDGDVATPDFAAGTKLRMAKVLTANG